MGTDLRGPLFLSAAAGIWGGMYVVSKYALDTIPPFTLLFIRYFLAAVTLVWWSRLSGVNIIPRQDKGTLFQIGLFGYFLSLAAQFIGTKLSSAHMGAVITSLSPVFQSGFAILILGEKITARQMVAICLAFAGVLIVTGLPGFSNGDAFDSGTLFFLVAACLWGYYSVLTKKVADGVSPLQITTWGIILATLFSLPFAWWELTAWNVGDLVGLPILLSILYLAFFSTTIAYYCWNKGLLLMSPHKSGLFFFLQPVVGSILGYLILDEYLSISFFWGSLLILLGVYFVMKASN
ncbi:MAG TPA: EamA family transporter [Methylomusa anaerophila]|uniref:Putative amino-acid metabolite efflux pump n=1 Tax=Methylomusa anaerophila TaxID=1930071 RepID=A0A348ALX4_9FIRM|nr:EamA family transporter [Methylomusa anaerophila]BBB92072.1 putative amino-acid metabolite efflux pump [Methylomusa anaerophila]HML87916.1 EamA family transporter [Methylomusa anaerophila]